MKTCSEVMTSNPTCCLPSDTVEKAARLMEKENVGSIPVVENEQTNKLIGIVTDRDLALKVVAKGRDPKMTTVEEVMTRDLVTCRPEDDLQKVINAMEEHQVRRIPIVDSNNRVVGIIAQGDIATRTDEPETTAEMLEEISKHRGWQMKVSKTARST